MGGEKSKIPKKKKSYEKKNPIDKNAHLKKEQVIIHLPLSQLA